MGACRADLSSVLDPTEIVAYARDISHHENYDK